MSVAAFTSPGNTSVLQLGAVVGDREFSSSLGVPGYMTSGDLAPLDAGDFSALPGITIEFWFQFQLSTLPSSHILMRGPEVSAGVRQWTVSTGLAGRPVATVWHSASGAITASSSSGVTNNTWYHVAVVVLGPSLILYLNGVAVATTAWPSGTGTVTTATYAAGGSDVIIGATSGNTVPWAIANIAFYNYGLSAARVGAHYTAGTARGFPEQTSGARINAALNAVGSTAPRSIDAGVRSVIPTYMSGQTPDSIVREAVSAEVVDAAFFVAADGTLVFRDSDHRSSSPYNTSQATFGDGVGELPYLDVTIDYSDSFLANDWNVTRDGNSASPGATQSVSDTTSISRYFKRSQSLTGLPVVSDTDSLAVATAMLAKYKDAMTRITRLILSTLDTSAADAFFRRELMDKITVKRTPPGGGARISQDLYIQKIDISGDNTGVPWTITWGVSPL